MPTSEYSRTARIPKATDFPTPLVIEKMMLECVGDPNWELTQLVPIIRQDSILTGRILEAAAKTTPCRPVKTIEEAVVRVGRNAMVSIVLSSFLTQRPSFHGGPAGAWRETYWQRSVIESVSAAFLAKAFGLDSGRYFLAGLISNVGIFALLHTHADTFPSMLESAMGSDRQLLKSEQRDLGFTHTELCHLMLRSWRVDDSIVDALAGQSNSAVDLLTEPNLESSRLRCACFIASRIARLYEGYPDGNEQVVVESLTRKYFDYSFEELLHNVSAELRRVGRAMDIDPDALADPEAIYATARSSFSTFLNANCVLDSAM